MTPEIRCLDLDAPGCAALSAIEAGDAAWEAGNRKEAARLWREALGEDPAAEAMARIRLIAISGNYGPLIHGPALDRALARCPDTDPWCLLAQADAELRLPAFTGADADRGRALLLESPLPEAQAHLKTPASGPGTWVLTLGLGVAPGSGVGGQLRFDHPDLAWKGHFFSARAQGDSRGTVFGAGFLRLERGVLDPAFALQGGQLVGDLYSQESATEIQQQFFQLDPMLTTSGSGWALSVGARLRADRFEEEWLESYGNTVGFRVQAQSWRLEGALDAGVGDYAFFRVDAGVVPSWSLGKGVFTGKLGGSGVFVGDAIFWRLPGAGGSQLLRGQASGRYRGSLLSLQAEFRYPIIGPLWGAAFADSAWIEEGLHWSSGGGLRLVLPPAGLNTTRLDLGFGEGSWGVVLGWGEAF